MLTHPTHDRLLALGLTGIAKALEEQPRSTAFDDLSFEERLGILFNLSEVKGPVMDRLKRSDFLQVLTDSIYMSQYYAHCALGGSDRRKTAA